MPDFRTERLPLAIFLHATGRLCFLGCKPNGDGRLHFVFSDPEQAGAQAKLEYERGASVAATALFASQKFLRRRMNEALNNRNSGEPKYAYGR